MAKRNAQSQPKLFNINLESLLMSDDSQDEQNDSQASSNESNKHPKIFKSKDMKPLPANKIKATESTTKVDILDQTEDDLETEDFKDVSKIFENFGNDFGKSMQMRKTRLNQFTDAAISIYESKLIEMVKRQECEVKELKKHALDNIQDELNKGEEEFKKIKLQENKIVKALEQQMKFVQKTVTNLEAVIENFNQLHKNFIQAFEELKMKHRNEILELKKTLATDMSTLQSKFLTESKKEELQTVKKYLNAIYF